MSLVPGGVSAVEGFIALKLYPTPTKAQFRSTHFHLQRNQNYLQNKRGCSVTETWLYKLFTTWKKSTDQKFLHSAEIKNLLLAFIFCMC